MPSVSLQSRRGAVVVEIHLADQAIHEVSELGNVLLGNLHVGEHEVERSARFDDLLAEILDEREEGLRRAARTRVREPSALLDVLRVTQEAGLIDANPLDALMAVF